MTWRRRPLLTGLAPQTSCSSLPATGARPGTSGPSWCSAPRRGSASPRRGGCSASGSARCRGCGSGFTGRRLDAGGRTGPTIRRSISTTTFRQVRCPPPGDERALLDLAADQLGEPLPRSRPLWSATFVTGLAGGGTGCSSSWVRHEAHCYIARAAGRDERRYLWI